MEDKTLRVLILDEDPVRAQAVASCLDRNGFETTVAVTNAMGILKHISDVAPDVVVVDMESPGRDVLESLSIVSSHQPRPILMFSAEEDPGFINRAVESGVSAYIVGEPEGDKVKSAIDVAMAQFRAFQNLQRQLEETRLELDERYVIDRAKHLLMAQQGIDEETAYQHLRKSAMNCQRKVIEVAQEVINQGERSR